MKSRFNCLIKERISNNPNYTIDNYKQDIDNYGLKEVWQGIVGLFNNKEDSYGVLSINNFGELYEIGMAHVDKVNKKEHGKYYTPSDVADLMSEWLMDLKGEKICDVCCGTGNLILSYLDTVGEEKAKALLLEGNIYLYDQDELALYICKSTLEILYGKEVVRNVHCVQGDFLNKEIKLPNDCKVISNPPYYKIKEIKDCWEATDVVVQTKELYSAIMEKVIKNSEASVFITPYSFIGASKFYSLRELMSDYNGFILSFDNVPTGIFTGRKHGIFNSNSSNSVRSAFTVVENKENTKGFKCSPLLRFRSQDRAFLLQREVLESFIGTQYQTIHSSQKRFTKCFLELEGVLNTWSNKSNQTLSDLICVNGQYRLYIPNTCRYYTVGTQRELERFGKMELLFNDIESFAYAYCLVNSSFCYWYWRMYDGGITYPISLLKEVPVFLDVLTKDDREELIKIALEMIELEEKYLVYKKNAGKLQENVKFPIMYRKKINQIFFNVLGLKNNISDLDIIHSNTVVIN